MPVLMPLPEAPKCPISQMPIEDAVFAADGHCYERECIAQWIARQAQLWSRRLPHALVQILPFRLLKSPVGKKGLLHDLAPRFASQLHALLRGLLHGSTPCCTVSSTAPPDPSLVFLESRVSEQIGFQNSETSV